MRSKVDACENIINKSKNKGFNIGPALKSCESRGNKGRSNANALSTQGDSSSNGTRFGERKYSTTTKMKSNSMSSGSNDRNIVKKQKKGSSEPKFKLNPKEAVLNIDKNKQPEFCQRIKMKDENSRNLYYQQNNHYRYKLYSSGERDPEEGPGNYLAKTSEKLKLSKKQVKDLLSKSRAKATHINPVNIKNNEKLKKTRGRSNKCDPLSSRNSSGEGTITRTIKIK